MSTTSTSDRLHRLLEPVVTAGGLDLEEVTVAPAGKRRLVRVVVDREGGVSLDDVAKLSQSISTELDNADVMSGGPYVLEVTSPGIDRPLTAPRHWRRARSRLVRVTLGDGAQLSGRVQVADDDGVRLDLGGGERRLEYSEIARARVEVEFNRPTAGDDDEAAGEAADPEEA